MKHIVSLMTVFTVMLCALLFSTVAYATGYIQISPLRLVLSDTVNTTTLIVKNRAITPSLVQLELLAWSQQNNTEILDPTRDILISPPVFTIAANSEQILRVVLRRKADSNKELTYRLFLREVEDKSQIAKAGEIKVLLNISIPIFVQPMIKPQPKLLWRASVDAAQKIQLKLINEGSQHIQIKSFQLASGDKNLYQSSMRYVLPGSTVEWVIDAKGLTLNSSLSLQAVTDNGDLRETITLEKP